MCPGCRLSLGIQGPARPGGTGVAGERPARDVRKQAGPGAGRTWGEGKGGRGLPRGRAAGAEGVLPGLGHGFKTEFILADLKNGECTKFHVSTRNDRTPAVCWVQRVKQ